MDKTYVTANFKKLQLKDSSSIRKNFQTFRPCNLILPLLSVCYVWCLWNSQISQVMFTTSFVTDSGFGVQRKFKNKGTWLYWEILALDTSLVTLRVIVWKISNSISRYIVWKFWIHLEVLAWDLRGYFSIFVCLKLFFLVDSRTNMNLSDG